MGASHLHFPMIGSFPRFSVLPGKVGGEGWGVTAGRAERTQCAPNRGADSPAV